MPLTAAAAAEFTADFIPVDWRHPQAIDIRGTCPGCHHFVHYVLHLREFAPDTESDVASGTARGFAAQPSDEAAARPEPPSFRFALNCNCAETHESAGKDKVSGCGAWFNVAVERDGEHALRPGSPSLSQYEMQNAQVRDQAASSELQRVRAAAASWKTGLAALFVLVPTLVVVKGTDTVDSLASTDKIVVGGLIAFGATLAVIATLIALRAAYGPLRRLKIVGDDNTIPVVTEVEKTVFALQATRVLTVVASAALATAIGYAWATPKAPALAYFSVSLSNGTSVCGKLAGGDPAAVRVQTADGETIAYSLADVKSSTFVASC